MYAVIKTGGKQYSVKVGDVVYVEKLNAEDNSEVTFDQVLAVGEEGSVKVGAPVRAVADGVVSAVKEDPMWGTVVEITHADDLVSRYCGLDEELSVVEGQAVSIADEIGRVGDTNLAETALEPHLHFELFEDGVRVDPLDRMGFYESDD